MVFFLEEPPARTFSFPTEIRLLLMDNKLYCFLFVFLFVLSLWASLSLKPFWQWMWVNMKQFKIIHIDEFQCTLSLLFLWKFGGWNGSRTSGKRNTHELHIFQAFIHPFILKICVEFLLCARLMQWACYNQWTLTMCQTPCWAAHICFLF